jgi:predicted transcriptional regulator
VLEKSILEEMINLGLSTHKIAERLECGQTTVRYYLAKYDLRTQRTRKYPSVQKCYQCQTNIVDVSRKRLFCSGTCQHRHQYEQYINRWLDGKEKGSKGAYQVSQHIRRWLIEQRGEQCWECGWNEKHPTGGNVPIEVDHIDGDHTWNVPENLRLLCPNCHSLTPTYKNRNKGNGRHKRRERYQSGKSY